MWYRHRYSAGHRLGGNRDKRGTRDNQLRRKSGFRRNRTHKKDNTPQVEIPCNHLHGFLVLFCRFHQIRTLEKYWPPHE